MFLCMCMYILCVCNSSQSYERCITKLGMDSQWVTGMIGYWDDSGKFILFNKQENKYGQFLPTYL